MIRIQFVAAHFARTVHKVAYAQQKIRIGYKRTVVCVTGELPKDRVIDMNGRSNSIGGGPDWRIEAIIDYIAVNVLILPIPARL